MAVGTYHLSLPTGAHYFKNCLTCLRFAETLFLFSCLDKKGFTFIIKNNSCSFALNDITYNVAQIFNGLYVLDLDTPIYNVNNK